MAIQSLTRTELLAVLRCAKATRERDWLMILLAFWHGLRATEVIAMQADAIADGHLTVQRLKGSMKTVQPLRSHADPLLNLAGPLIEYASKVPFSTRLFKVSRQHFWRLFQRYAEQAGVPAHKRHPHVLKHSIAMQTIESAGIENVRQYLGHKSISSTGAYLKVSDDDAAEAIQRAAGV